MHDSHPAHALPNGCPLVELRQYTLRPGARDTLIELFDRAFVETQEAVGMWVIGQFRDLDDPDRFVWLRGFTDMPARAQALQAFYGGAVWQANRDAANATMLDSDNVLLLRPVTPATGFALAGNARPAPGQSTADGGLVVVTIYPLGELVDSDIPTFFMRTAVPALHAAGAAVCACLVTEPSRNTFPALPVREGESVLVWVACFANPAAHARHVAELEQSPQWRDTIMPALVRQLAGPPQVLRLLPTARSLLRAASAVFSEHKE